MAAIRQLTSRVKRGRRKGLADNVHQGNRGESKLQMDLCETREGDLRDPL